MEFVGVESEQTIEQELADAMEMLKDDQSNRDVAELVQGLTDASRLLKLIMLMEEWIQTKQFNK